MVKHNPMDDALTELMDAWMDLMSVTNRPLSTPVSKPNNIGDWEDRNGEIAITVDMPGISKKDINEFIDQLTSGQFDKILDFFNTMPKLRHVIPVTNPKTQVESEVVVEGLASFLV